LPSLYGFGFWKILHVRIVLPARGPSVRENEKRQISSRVEYID